MKKKILKSHIERGEESTIAQNQATAKEEEQQQRAKECKVLHAL